MSSENVIKLGEISREEAIHMLGVLAAYLSPYSEESGIKPASPEEAISKNEGIWEGIYELAAFDKVMEEVNKDSYLCFIRRGLNVIPDLLSILVGFGDINPADAKTIREGFAKIRKEVITVADNIIEDYKEVFPEFRAVKWWHKSKVCRDLTPYSYFRGGTKRRTMWLKNMDAENTDIIEAVYRGALYLWLYDHPVKGHSVDERFNELKELDVIVKECFNNTCPLLMYRSYKLIDDVGFLSSAWQTDVPEVLYRMCRIALSWDFRNRHNASSGVARLESLI